MEKISVIIPTYNRAKELKRSVESVRAQTYDNFELIIVDDGSKDNTQEVIASIPDERIRYIKLEQNRGAAGARNEGVRASKCDLIAFQDSDDIWREEKLERQMEYWRIHPDCGLVYCAYQAHRILEGKIVDEWVVSAQNGDSKRSLLGQLLRSNSIGTPAMLMKKECFLGAGGFNESLRSLEDWDLALRIAEKYEIGYVNEILLDAYPSQGGISSGIGAYFDGRCRMIAGYRSQMAQEGVFDLAVGELLQKAQKQGVLEAVKKMLLLYMGG